MKNTNVWKNFSFKNKKHYKALFVLVFNIFIYILNKITTLFLSTSTNEDSKNEAPMNLNMYDYHGYLDCTHEYYGDSEVNNLE
ncbi:hypothetical protein [Phocoenobacter skyensis]|uniref:hypothetical protein n=1 Tax=Phocoenobacter skyensis TaxID=97481 RepID=UPI002749F08E|nr:hypothetical protein [Pasteurella skyensis]MDP8185327.1 hypothetical protein [Pasteurella skyensis]